MEEAAKPHVPRVFMYTRREASKSRGVYHT
jgi:hypothetical protein